MTTHLSPRRGDGGLTPCCGKTVFELPRLDRITLHRHLVDCEVLPIRIADVPIGLIFAT